MNTNIAFQRTKRSLTLVVMLLAVVFLVEPILSLQPVALAASPAAAAGAAGQTTVRRRRRHRSFWKKHRDKLTVAGTTVAGAGIGGIAGGKKGALIGAGVGAGSGALYTYKLRRRRRRY